MLSTSHLRYEDRGQLVAASYLDGRCEPLVDALRACYEAHAGKSRRELEAAVGSLPAVEAVSPMDARLVPGLCRVLDELVRFEVRSPVAPEAIRAAAFLLAAGAPEAEPGRVLEKCAASLGLADTSLAPLLYADLHRERVVVRDEPLPPAHEVLRRYNFRLAQGLLLCSEHMRVQLESHPRAVYRLAKLNGLIVVVETSPRGDAAPTSLEVTGPLSLFQHTLRYGRALAAFLPACALSPRFRVEARLWLGGRSRQFVLTEADPVLTPHSPPRETDSAIEARFLRDFNALQSPWRLRREVELLQVGPALFFPDFTLDRPDRPGVKVHVEIVGFWTREYLARKHDLMRGCAGRNVIFCVDQSLCCDRDLDTGMCIPFKRWVPAGAVLAAAEALGSGPPLPGGTGALPIASPV